MCTCTECALHTLHMCMWTAHAACARTLAAPLVTRTRRPSPRRRTRRRRLTTRLAPLAGRRCRPPTSSPPRATSREAPAAAPPEGEGSSGEICFNRRPPARAARWVGGLRGAEGRGRAWTGAWRGQTRGCTLMWNRDGGVRFRHEFRRERPLLPSCRCGKFVTPFPPQT